jgi:hypothetical protein
VKRTPQGKAKSNRPAKKEKAPKVERPKRRRGNPQKPYGVQHNTNLKIPVSVYTFYILYD